MQTYLVGGAVRDELLGLAVKDRDWVVVGARPEELEAEGFQRVGADFPVFLHPRSKEEYALARTERKSGHGYTGFEVQFDPSVTLEDDLLRRDLTINAIAKSDTGELIDPYGGLADIKARQLRHVSPAFREDPLRVLRVARFAARFAHLGFEVAHETRELMRAMVADGELKFLVHERVWQEMSRALLEPNPEYFFRELRACGALKIILPEFDALFGVPQTMRWHPEIDTGIHTLKALQIAVTLSDSLEVRLATLCHDFGKGLTDPKHWPSHRGHEDLGANAIAALAAERKWPKKPARLAELTARYHTHCHKIGELKAATIVKTLEAFGAFRAPETFEHFLLACEADARGRSGLEQQPYPEADQFRDCLNACLAVKPADLMAQGYAGAQLGEAIHRARVNAVKDVQTGWN
ncbi:multifunctional CCA addition/repair protein [Saccharospirillum mangrovi]|uniref:multifunctional CCA addition/repair protein n=1 Tax=Saccharospirillum mangrovi TaxID=2161747 RepID=UPI000D345B81|nr:multifunctional CCA addition/repair protein [Saccharospirillum mangrovi]